MSLLEFRLLREHCVVWIMLVEIAPGALVIKMTRHVYYKFQNILSLS